MSTHGHTHIPPPWVYADGGRGAVSRALDVGDCVTRAITIVGERDYTSTYAELSERAKAYNGRRHKVNRRKRTSARDGVPIDVIRGYLAELGWTWVPAMEIGSTERLHLCLDELPHVERAVLQLSKHLTALIGDVVFDTHDPARAGGRLVYGYWLP